MSDAIILTHKRPCLHCGRVSEATWCKTAGCIGDHGAARGFFGLRPDTTDLFADPAQPSPAQVAALLADRVICPGWKNDGSREPCGRPQMVDVYSYDYREGSEIHPDLWHVEMYCGRKSDVWSCPRHGLAVDRQTWDRPTPERWAVLNPEAHRARQAALQRWAEEGRE